MPVDPGDGERLAAKIGALLAQVELALLAQVRGAVRSTLDDRGSIALLGQVDRLRVVLATGARAALPAILEQARSIMAEAVTAGRNLAAADLKTVRIAPHTPAGDPARALAAPLEARIRLALDRAPDALVATAQRAVAAAEHTPRGVTRLAAAQQVLDRLGADGITGYRDARGRNWSLGSYVEMGVRTAAGQAAVAAHTDSLAASGLDLVVVSDAPRECPLCRPWEGKVLSLSGAHRGEIDTRSVTGAGTVRVHVAGTLAEAKAAGFQHPNCRHSVSAYLPGATRLPERTADPAGYEATQRQRALERNVRMWKRRQALALDDATARAAGVKVRAWQKALREHTAAHDLQRLHRREQIGVAT